MNHYLRSYHVRTIADHLLLFKIKYNRSIKMDKNIIWVEPTKAASPATDMKAPVLTATDVATWRENGYCLVDGVFPSELLELVIKDCQSVFPPPLSEEAKKINYYGGFVNFPSTYDSVNQVALHPRIMNAVAQLFGVPDLTDCRLTQTEVWPKYGRTDLTYEKDEEDNADQRMHCDFPSHTLVHPPPWDEPEAVSIILYLSKVEDCYGATAVVPRTGKDDPAYTYPLYQQPGFGTTEWKNNRKIAENYLQEVAPDIAEFRAKHLYAREKQVRYKLGTVLFYRQDTWHRGTVLKPGCLRVVVNMTFRKAISEWISTMHIGWAWGMMRKGLPIERLVANASVEQRCVMGFPKPGHQYWNKQTLLAVAARYEKLGMDMKPYADAITEAH